MTLNNLLKEKEIEIEDLILDPNNPRFSKHHDEITPEDKFEDLDIQEDAYRRMTDPKNNFEIDVLLAAIRADGFIHVDKIFVRKVNKKFLVIEGNRRVTAIKKLLKNHKNNIKGYEVSADLLKQIKTLPCVLIDINGPESEEQIQKILGLRHHGSILPWKPLPAAFNLYQKYMTEFCLQNNSDPKDENNFLYDPLIAKKVAAIFSVEWTDVRKQIKLYRIYLQLLEVSHRHPSVESSDSFSMIQETLSKASLTKYFEYDEEKSIFSENGTERFLDLYFGLKDKPAIITQASAGDSTVRDFSFVVSEGGEEGIRRIVEDREVASKVAAEVRMKLTIRNLKNTLEFVMNELNKINLGEIGLDGFAPNEKDFINKIDEKILQLKRAAGLK